MALEVRRTVRSSGEDLNWILDCGGAGKTSFKITYVARQKRVFFFSANFTGERPNILRGMSRLAQLMAYIDRCIS
jgi:hypothetical protein